VLYVQVPLETSSAGVIQSFVFQASNSLQFLSTDLSLIFQWSFRWPSGSVLFAV